MTLGKLSKISFTLFCILLTSSCTKVTNLVDEEGLSSSSRTASLEDKKEQVIILEKKPTPTSSSLVLSGLGLEDYEKVAKQIFLVKNAMSEEFPVGDGLTFTMYILRYLAEVGDYILTNEDISDLLTAFEKISGEKLNETVYETVAGIKEIEFGESAGKYTVKIKAFDTKNGVLIPINEVPEDGMVQEIIYARIKDGAEIKFDDIDDKSKRKALTRFLKEKITIPLVSETLLPPLNQLHKNIKFDLDNYLETTKIIPLEIKTEGIYIKVNTSTVFNNMKFYLRSLYTLPGRKKGRRSIPSLVMRIRAKLVNVKISIDQ